MRKPSVFQTTYADGLFQRNRKLIQNYHRMCSKSSAQSVKLQKPQVQSVLFFFLLSFSSFALQEERDGDKRNYSDWRLGCHRRSVLIAVAVTVLLCTNN